MRTYTINPRPADFSWDNIPALPIDQYFNTDPSIPISAQAQICYDDTAIYVRLSAVEAEISAAYTGLLDEVSEDSCLEFFFSPIEGDRRYFNFECNLNGAMYMGFGSGIDDLVRLIQEEPVIVPKGQRTADGWEVTYAIPHEFVRRFFPDYSPAPGGSIRANCFKCGSLTPIQHYISWSPVVQLPRAAFHNPDCFGIMYFG